MRGALLLRRMGAACLEVFVAWTLLVDLVVGLLGRMGAACLAAWTLLVDLVVQLLGRMGSSYLEIFAAWALLVVGLFLFCVCGKYSRHSETELGLLTSLIRLLLATE